MGASSSIVAPGWHVDIKVHPLVLFNDDKLEVTKLPRAVRSDIQSFVRSAAFRSKVAQYTTQITNVSGNRLGDMRTSYDCKINKSTMESDGTIRISGVLVPTPHATSVKSFKSDSRRRSAPVPKAKDLPVNASDVAYLVREGLHALTHAGDDFPRGKRFSLRFPTARVQVTCTARSRP